MRAVLLALLLSFFTTPVFADSGSAADSQLNNVIADYWEYYLRTNPTAATYAGIYEFNDRLPSVTVDAQQEALAMHQALLRRAQDIDRDAMSDNGRINADLLIWTLEDSIGAAELDLARIPFNTFWGFFMNALRASSNVSMQEVSDYEDYLARMREIPRYFAENIDNMRRGVDEGFVLPQIVIDGVLPTVQAQVKDSAEDSSFS